MKRLISVLSAALVLGACQQVPQAGPFMNPQPMLQQNRMMAASAQDPGHHPDFLRKMSNPGQYRFQEGVSANSICGSNELQHVNDYNGNPGQPVEFVKKHKSAVGALAKGDPANSRKFCSGTLIGEDLFLTASHCIDASVTQDKSVAFNYEKAPGSNDLLPQEHFKVVEVIEDGINRLDYAILRLDGKPGLKYGFTRVRAAQPENQHLLTIIQHPRGQAKQTDSGPMVGSSGAYMLYADLDTEPGSSGSGVLDREGLIIGVHTNGGCHANGGANRGVKMTEIIKGSRVIQELNAGMQNAPVPEMFAMRRR